MVDYTVIYLLATAILMFILNSYLYNSLYVQQVETMSTQSTAQSLTGSGWEDPFNQDSLGDTVIHLEKVRF